VCAVLNYREFVEYLIKCCARYEYSYLGSSWSDLDFWKGVARSKLRELLAIEFSPEFLDPSIDMIYNIDGVSVEKVLYRLAYGGRAEAFLMYPRDRVGKRLPAVIALHDHGGFKFFGKEKIARVLEEPSILVEYKVRSYGGRSWAFELAKKGFAVFAVDTFLFGSRRIEFGEGSSKGIDDIIKTYNESSYKIENLVAKVLSVFGFNVLGTVVYEDLAALEYLFSRSDVIDVEKIAVAGWSLGGLRALLLGALDDRIKCVAVACAMSTLDEILLNGIEHAWTLYIPNAARYFDLPDIASIHMPRPMLVQYCREDKIFPLKGQIKAHEKLSNLYKKAGAIQNYLGIFYQKPHIFDVEMQEDAFNWIERCLAN
jgi:dienelactone hydrolase